MPLVIWDPQRTQEGVKLFAEPVEVSEAPVEPAETEVRTQDVAEAGIIILLEVRAAPEVPAPAGAAGGQEEAAEAEGQEEGHAEHILVISLPVLLPALPVHLVVPDRQL
jgi:hypothetical protein